MKVQQCTQTSRISAAGAVPAGQFMENALSEYLADTHEFIAVYI